MMKPRIPLGIKPRWLAGLFLLSCTFPVAASFLAPSDRPAWLGILDLSIAFLIVIAALWLDYVFGKLVTAQQRDEAYVTLNRASILILVLLGTFIYLNEILDWPVLIVGLAWRAWLFIYALPAWIAFRDLK